MTINEGGGITAVSFWPADEIAAAFGRVNAALGKPDELQEMRLFVRVMNYFYEQASETQEYINIDDDKMAEVCRLAKIGLYAEFGMASPEGETA
jgi:hypothetical protein